MVSEASSRHAVVGGEGLRARATPVAPIAVVFALPLLLAAAVDAPASARPEVVEALFLAPRRDGVGLGTLLAPIAALVPLGPAALRVAIAHALGPALAAALVTRRALVRPYAAPRSAVVAVTLAFGAMAAALLLIASPAVSLAAIGCELALLTTPAPSVALGLAPLLAWADLRVLPSLVLALIRARSRVRWAVATIVGVATLVPLALAIALRASRAPVALGRWTLLRSRTAVAPLLTGPIGRLTLVLVALSGFAVLLREAGRGASDDEKSAVLGSVGAAIAMALGAGDALALAAIGWVPVAAAACLALHRFTDPSRAGAAAPTTPTRLAVAWLVPALALGLASRAFEEQWRTRRAPMAQTVSAELAPILTLGLAPAEPVVLVEDDAALLAWAGARASLGLRPDALLMPAGPLLLGAPAFAAARAIDAEPSARPIAIALLASGNLGEADAAPLCLRRPLLATVAPTRLRGLARHVRPTPAGMQLSLERVDPSDRRLGRTTLARHAGALERAQLPSEDALVVALRSGEESMAWLLAASGDREAATFALGRAAKLGAPSAMVNDWSRRLAAKAPLPDPPGDLR